MAPAMVIYASLLSASPAAGWWCCSMRWRSCCGWLGSTRCSTTPPCPPTPGNSSSGCPPGRRDRGARAAGRQTAVRQRLVELAVGRVRLGGGCSLLVVSRIPMKKMHAVAVPPNLAALLLAGLAIVAAAAFLFPYVLVMVAIAAYLCHIPLSVRSHRWLAEHPEVWGERPKQRRAVRRRSAGTAQSPVDGAAGSAQARRRT
ncbi:putative cDP-diacylglycerol--serine O-phosphatidyltransferase [Mycobacterium xenopi 4042]|uniref:Putative cDP-diacylglycerol--serine O-phosphatidyltransferase n=1 Tax=Mycobacterium xenopi 4042 TaxID=1299334 RepID=X8DM49_MYCXE|nr:putative cDP-diacylglycerol--serine O-phosphatidyltransferase [Mycobacterium xenopi 4042]